MSEESTTADLVELQNRLTDAGSRRDLDVITAFFAPDAVYDMSPMGMGTFEGQAEPRGFLEDWFASYEEYELEAEEILDLGKGVCELGADALLLLTDVPYVERNHGTKLAHPIHEASPRELDLAEFADGSTRPKIEAACRFASQTGKIAAIGALADAPAILAGQAGTHITSDSAESPTAPSESALGCLGERAAALDEDIRTASLLRDHPATAHSADPCSDSPSHRRR
jgi:SnoaL-like domain/Amino acid kinase family